MAGKIASIYNFGFTILDFKFQIKNFKFVILIALSNLIFEHFCYAQTPRTPFSFEQFIDDKGTLANSNNCFLQNKDNFLWIATNDGLKRFDGNDFTIFKHETGNENSLLHNSVYSLCEDKLGRIWTGTEEGVGYFDKKTNKFFNFKELNKRDNVCLNLLCDANGDVWFSIRDKGIFRYSEKTKKLQNFAFNPNDKTTITSNRVLRKSMEFDAKRNGIWFTTLSGVNFFDYKTQQFFNHRNNPKNLKIFQIKDVSETALDGENLIFYDSDAQKLKYYDIENDNITKEIVVKSQNKKETSDIAYVYVNKQHNLWLMAWNNTTFFYDVKTAQIYELIHDSANPNSIAASSFWCVFEQNDGAVWLGTKNGISITNPRNAFYDIYDISALYEPLKNDNQLTLFTEDSADSTWWLAANTNIFLHFFPQKNLLEIFKIPIKTNDFDAHIEALIEQKNEIFVVARKFIYRFDKKQKTLSEIPIPRKFISEKGISSVNSEGDKIWFFSENFVAFSYEISTKTWKEYPVISENKINKWVSCSAFDDNNDLWIGIHATGLAKFSKKKRAFELVKTANEVDFSRIGFYSMKKDHEGNFWIGSYNLIKFDPKARTFLSALEISLYADLIIDKEGKIWSSAYNDFTIFYPKTQKVLTASVPINKGSLLWTNHLFSLRNGQIISLMQGNVVKIEPAKLIPPSTNDKVLISKIALADGEILVHNDSSVVNLEASKNGFGIFFSALIPPNYHKYRYEYQLSGYQKNWISTQNNTASFSNLDGGEYVFQVKGIDANGYETPVSTLKIHIETVFYKSKWFLYSGILAICALIYAFVRFRANQRAKIHLLQVQSTRLEKDKTEIQYQNLINHLNPHFLFNSLTSLNSLIMTEPKSASKFLQKLSLIYRYILQNKDKDVVSLEQEIAFVKHYIDLQKSRFGDGLEIKIEVENEYLSSGIVPVTLQNLFENAIKHNTVEEDKPLIIKVLAENDYLIVKNNLQKKHFVETSNKQGLDSLKNLYKYLTDKPLETIETDQDFLVKVPLL